MRHFIFYLFAACFIFCIGTTAWAADDVKPTSDKTITDKAKDAKTEAVKVYQESKDAIVRDAKSMKEEIPKGLKESKEALIEQSKEVKESATKEFKEIRDNLKNPKLTPRTDSK